MLDRDAVADDDDDQGVRGRADEQDARRGRSYKARAARRGANVVLCVG